MPKNKISADIYDTAIWKQYPGLLDTLLVDHSMSMHNGSPCNIIWATDDYEALGKGYGFHDQILPGLISGECSGIIRPHAFKGDEEKRTRMKLHGEVSTPAWVCNAQCNLVDKAKLKKDGLFNIENPDRTWTVKRAKIKFPKGMSWLDYINDSCLEITCGEAPYLVSRYDASTGKFIPVGHRVGLLDRKLRVAKENTTSAQEWSDAAVMAYKSTFGYEWQGDSLLIARQSMLYTFIEYHRHYFKCDPADELIFEIADIVSWNLWQMDGLRGVVPGSCHTHGRGKQRCKGCASKDLPQAMHDHNGVYALFKDWADGKIIEYHTLSAGIDEQHPDK